MHYRRKFKDIRSVVVPWTGIALAGYAAYAATEQGCQALNPQPCITAGTKCGTQPASGSAVVGTNGPDLPQCASVSGGGNQTCTATASAACTYYCDTYDSQGGLLGEKQYINSPTTGSLSGTTC
jgi:hypothetical protein